MTERRRAAFILVALALGLGLLAVMQLVVSGTSTVPSAATYIGQGSTTVSTRTTLAGSVTSVADGTESVSIDSSHRPITVEPDRSFEISVGNVSGLYPGRRNRIPVVFHNPQAIPISVRTATTTATGPAGCPLETSLILRTRTFIHSVLVPAHGLKAKSLRFGMRKTATDACQDGVFTITVTATAVRA